ncbi:MAG TPA: hypothetical protein VFT74_12140 [Isosphaeraceae bacterium]|nr:hypothetical protein [Isosphaeraceae bacterium]
MRALLKRLQTRFDVSDEAYVENCRRGLAQVDRIRWFLRGFVIVGLVCLGWACKMLFDNLANPLLPGMNAGFALGVMLGIVFGSMLHNVAHQLLTLLSSMRSERLMVRYHDELQQVHQEWRSAGPAQEADPADESSSE